MFLKNRNSARTRYHATDDPRMPTQFICFDCRIRADITWELIKIDLYPRVLTKFKDLALFRWGRYWLYSLTGCNKNLSIGGLLKLPRKNRVSPPWDSRKLMVRGFYSNYKVDERSSDVVKRRGCCTCWSNAKTARGWRYDYGAYASFLLTFIVA